MLSFLQTALAFIVAIGVLVVIHEFGHYAVARLCGVKVLRFAVGFGQVLWSRRSGPDQTEWAICAIPLGGYVKMLDEREGEVPTAELGRAFNRQSVGKRSAIVAAGPLANLLLAIALYFTLFMYGVEELRPILGTPEAGTMAARAGVQRGDEVLAVNGQPVSGWEGLRWEMLRLIADGQPAALTLRRDGGSAGVTLETLGIDIDTVEGDPLGTLGLGINPPRVPAVIGKVMPDSPAAAAGLEPGDRIVSIDGQPVALFDEVSKIVRASPGKPLTMGVERKETTLEIKATPRAEEGKGGKIGRMGFMSREDPALREAMFATVRYPAAAALHKAAVQTWDSSIFTLRMIGRMITGQLSLKNLTGPITIAEYAGQSAQLGLAYFIKFLAIISISIGVLNLLPIPVLDGGHLMYYLAESLRGKPLSERIFEAGQKVGLALLMLMMSIALFNDLNRQFFG